MTAAIDWQPVLHRATLDAQRMVQGIISGESITHEVDALVARLSPVVSARVVMVGDPEVVDSIDAAVHSILSCARELPVVPADVARRSLWSIVAQIATLEALLRNVDSYPLPQAPKSAPRPMPAAPSLMVSFSDEEERVIDVDGMAAVVLPPSVPIYHLDGRELPRGTTCDVQTSSATGTITYILTEPDGTRHVYKVAL
jgi:hypothetical protein